MSGVRPRRAPAAPHPSDGSDADGHGLDVVIRIGADGRVLLHDITADLIPVLLELNPRDAGLQRRAEAVGRLRPEAGGTAYGAGECSGGGLTEEAP